MRKLNYSTTTTTTTTTAAATTTTTNNNKNKQTTTTTTTTLLLLLLLLIDEEVERRSNQFEDDAQLTDKELRSGTTRTTVTPSYLNHLGWHVMNIYDRVLLLLLLRYSVLF